MDARGIGIIPSTAGRDKTLLLPIFPLTQRIPHSANLADAGRISQASLLSYFDGAGQHAQDLPSCCADWVLPSNSLHSQRGLGMLPKCSSSPRFMGLGSAVSDKVALRISEASAKLFSEG